MGEHKLARRRSTVPKTTARIYLPVKHALALTLLAQRERDVQAGLNTAGFVAGYQGSPLGNFDQLLGLLDRLGILKESHITFIPAVNEELGAGIGWGTQQIQFPEVGKARYDGVFALWYGKGPGLYRSMDMFGHMNMAGLSPTGGLVIAVGDDHASLSSTMAHSSEYALIHVGAPILAPSSPQDVFDDTILAWAISRYCGAGVALKLPTDLAEVSASVLVDPFKKIIIPQMPIPPGIEIYGQIDAKHLDEEAAKPWRIKRAQAFADANGLYRFEHQVPKKLRLGIAAVGRQYAEVMETLRQLGITDAMRQELGIAVCKIGMPWPLSIESPAMKTLCEAETILVVEDKAGVVEEQLRAALYNRPKRSAIYGKHHLDDVPLLPTTGALSLSQIAMAIARVYPMSRGMRFDISAKAEELERNDARARAPAELGTRGPHYCAGCPHSVSTKSPKGAKAYTGIGCHYMGRWVPDPVSGMSMTDDPTRHAMLTVPMGGEGTLPMAHLMYTDTSHAFQQVGDGTWSHSASLALRQAVAWSRYFPDRGITYKYLRNGSVAMTGGQAIEGDMSVPELTRSVRAEGVQRICVVAEDPDQYGPDADFAPGVTIHHRDELLVVEEELQKVRGISFLIFDQGCAAEKRRHRKRGTLAKSATKVFINPRVCEGCNDCVKQSNCPAVVPHETIFGTKRQIDLSCNDDKSCVKGFCPSFASVRAGTRASRRDLARRLAAMAIPEPELPESIEDYNILFKAIGGTGSVTLAEILGEAAHDAGLFAQCLAILGLSQKGGEVPSHLRISNERIFSTRVPSATADLLLGCDLLTAASPTGLAALKHGRSHVVVNLQKTPTAEFMYDPNKTFDKDKMLVALQNAVGKDHVHAIEATAYATELFGDAIAANMFLAGFAYQHGLIPIRLESIIEAIHLNEVEIEMNLEAFACGRYAAANRLEFESFKWKWRIERDTEPTSTWGLKSHFARELEKYQSKTYADRYRALVQRVESFDLRQSAAQPSPLLDAVMRNYFKLLAYKDEYEVARHYMSAEYRESLEREFGKDYKLAGLWLSPPIIAHKDKRTGLPKKMFFGPWIFKAMRVIKKFKSLRGTRMDPFGYTAERKEERALIVWYEGLIEEIGRGLNEANYDLAVEILRIPEKIRGYGHIKAASIVKAKAKAEALLKRFREKVIK